MKELRFEQAKILTSVTGKLKQICRGSSAGKSWFKGKEGQPWQDVYESTLGQVHKKQLLDLLEASAKVCAVFSCVICAVIGCPLLVRVCLACSSLMQALIDIKSFPEAFSVALVTTPKDFLTAVNAEIQQATSVVVATRVTEIEHKLAQVIKYGKDGKGNKKQIIKLMGKMHGYEKEFTNPSAVEGWEKLGHPQLVQEVAKICGEVQKSAAA